MQPGRVADILASCISICRFPARIQSLTRLMECTAWLISAEQNTNNGSTMTNVITRMREQRGRAPSPAAQPHQPDVQRVKHGRQYDGKDDGVRKRPENNVGQVEGKEQDQY